MRGHSGAAFGRSLHLFAHSSASSERCVRREAEICARTFWLREDEAELCPIEHFRKITALLRPAHMTAAFSSLCDTNRIKKKKLKVAHMSDNGNGFNVKLYARSTCTEVTFIVHVGQKK